MLEYVGVFLYTVDVYWLMILSIKKACAWLGEAANRLEYKWDFH